MLLPRQQCLAAVSNQAPDFSQVPLQLGMHGDAWLVAVASMLLCRTRRVQAGSVLEQLLSRWPSAYDLACSNTLDLQATVQPCGLHNTRARTLQRFSSLYTSENWSYLQELPGVGLYVADAVGLFCFGYTELDSSDEVLRRYVDRLRTSVQL